MTTLRNVIGSLDLEQTLTSRDQINAQLRGVLDEATGKWGIRVNRVELKAIDPPMSIQESMEKQMKAERDRRAVILIAEGSKQSNILTAEGEKQSQILRAEGSAQARILEAQGQARAIQQVFDAIHRGKPTQKLLAYQYLQVLPQIARGDANKMWIIPSELTDALRGIGGALGVPEKGRGPRRWRRRGVGGPGRLPRTCSRRPSSRTRSRHWPRPAAWQARPARRPPSTPRPPHGCSRTRDRPPTQCRRTSRRRSSRPPPPAPTAPPAPPAPPAPSADDLEPPQP